VALAFQGKPNSVWGGVPFGVFAPYRFGPETTDLEGALKALVRLGVSQTEIKKNGWAIPVGIEFEYLVPPGSTWDQEIAKCVQYGKNALPA
jgi:hypothetical protein